jgi:acetyl esterase
MIAEAGIPPMNTLPLAEARQAMLDGRINDIDPPPVTRVEDRSIPGPAGELPIRCYYPRQAAGEDGLPTLLYFHGGGFVIGDLDTHDILCRQLCQLADVLVIAVDYRLAPEHHYPAAVEDALASFDWLGRDFRDVGADPARLAVAGDSAGGTLAAVVAHHARDTARALRAQLLLYPVVDVSSTYPSHEEHAEIYPISKPVLDWFWSLYFGPQRELDASLGQQVWASPIRAGRFDDLAPAYVLTAGLDPLRDEAAAYAARLAEAGVETVYQCVMGTVHGFLRLGRLVPSARDALVGVAHFLRQRI